MTHVRILRGTLLIGLGMAVLAGCQKHTVQLQFDQPEGMMLDVQGQRVTVPGRAVVEEGSTTTMIISNIPTHPDMAFKADVSVTERKRWGDDVSEHFREHCTIPIRFEADDFDQAQANNLITKVVYLPDPENQELVFTGTSVLEPDVLISTRLEPGVDPIAEAERLGTILAVLRMGNRF